MCTYAEIENVVLSNGKTVKQVNEDGSTKFPIIRMVGLIRFLQMPSKH